jgi:hypothetical protein
MDLWRASGKRNWPQPVILCRYQYDRTWHGELYLSYKASIDLATRFKLRESSIRLLRYCTLKEPQKEPNIAHIHSENVEVMLETQKFFISGHQKLSSTQRISWIAGMLEDKIILNSWNITSSRTREYFQRQRCKRYTMDIRKRCTFICSWIFPPSP